MTHIISRNQLLTWLSDNAPDGITKRALDMGKVTVWGLFKGGWVVEAQRNGKSYVMGVKPCGIDGHLVCGRLSKVPFEDYVGGDSPLAKGDRPERIKNGK